MALETGSFISDLDETWPLGSDNVSQGDDQIRLIKAVLKSQFPNLDAAVNATPDELNQGGTPTGAVQMFAGVTAPTGYVLCDGRELVRADYADLYIAIGDTWGAGDGSTTFNVPDMQDKATAGVSGSNLLGSDAGKDTWVEADIPSHDHSMNSGGSHSHRINRRNSTAPAPINDIAVDYDTNVGGTYTTGSPEIIIESSGSH
ncbi:MAG: hypothetical protein DRI24_24450, partial [Deltaproteobacteria bacterium]